MPRLQAIERPAGELFRHLRLDTPPAAGLDAALGAGLHAIADDPPPDRATLLAHIESATAWVAVEDSLLAGYALASVVDGDGHLAQVSIDPAWSGRRIGAQLIGRVLAWASAAGFASVTLTTFRDVPWNAPYYRQLGFSDIPEADQGPQLQARRAAERAAGLDVSPRIAMRRHL